MLFQLLAPGVAMQGMAATAADPLAGASICTEDGSVVTRHKASHTQGGVCVSCVSCCTGVAAVFPVAAALPLPAERMAVTARSWTASLPRGPPLVRPRARSPPTLS